MRCALALVLLLLGGACAAAGAARRSALVFQSDFGLADGAVASMHGVARGVDPDLCIEDLTHDIPPFDVWAAAYRLHMTAGYWPPGTVFVSVVDPGVGTARRSVVLWTASGHYFVSPDNGTLTLVADALGIRGLREIDEARGRLPGSLGSHTFHGRDVYAYTGARLASGAARFEDVGPELPARVVRIDFPEASFREGSVVGGVPVLDVRFGNVWTNVDRATFGRLGAEVGGELLVEIARDGTTAFAGRMPLVDTFADVAPGALLAYFNSLGNLAFALNRESFAARHGIGAGADWRVIVRKAP